MDRAGQKGDAKWAVVNSMALAMPLNSIATAIFERSLSRQKDLRESASIKYPTQTNTVYNKVEVTNKTYSAIYASKLILYAQSFAMLQRASEAFGWKVNLFNVTRVWRNGCIIRNVLFDDIASIYQHEEKVSNLLLSTFFQTEIKQALPEWKQVVLYAMKEELPIPEIASSLNYFYSFKSAQLPANLIQAQRDYFGGHTFERTDELRGWFYHEDWREPVE